VTVHCYDDSNINIVVAITDTIILWNDSGLLLEYTSGVLVTVSCRKFTQRIYITYIGVVCFRRCVVCGGVYADK